VTQIFRVTVRGRFAALDDEQRARLTERLPAHSGLPGFGEPGGQLSYDERLDFFTLRIEVRERSEAGEDRTEAAFEAATARCEEVLADLGVAHRGLKAVGSDLSTVWR